MPPSIVLVAGPNGAGKSTLAPFLLRDALAVSEFVNADRIAQGLSAFNPETVALQAGRLMLARLDELARQRATFASRLSCCPSADYFSSLGMRS
jgi:predicted ABC-type ATPase